MLIFRLSFQYFFLYLCLLKLLRVVLLLIKFVSVFIFLSVLVFFDFLTLCFVFLKDIEGHTKSQVAMAQMAECGWLQIWRSGLLVPTLDP